MSAMVAAEPLLARTVALANSAWYNPGGRLVTDVPKALVRIGFPASCGRWRWRWRPSS